MISVIVTVHNYGKYLKRCLESVINQTYSELEIILIEDGSDDNSGVICDEYAQKDTRIKVFHTENNGIATTRNLGISKVSGDYIAFVDGDDYIHPMMFEKLLNNIIQYQADISCCSFVKLQSEDSAPELETEKISVLDRDTTMNQLPELNSALWNKLYKKKVFENVKFPDGHIHEDEYVAHYIIYHADRIVVSNQRLYNYVQHKNSIMSNYNSNRIYDTIYAYEDRIRFIKENKWDAVHEKTIEDYLWFILKHYYIVAQSNMSDSDIVKKTLLDIARRLLKSKKNKGSYKDFCLFCIHPAVYTYYKKIKAMVK